MVGFGFLFFIAASIPLPGTTVATIGSTRLTFLYNLLWDFRNAPHHDGEKAKGIEFAVLFLLGGADLDKVWVEPQPNPEGIDRAKLVYPLGEGGFKNYVTAKREQKKRGRHAEPQVLANLDNLMTQFNRLRGGPAKEMILFTWRCPCPNCSRDITNKLALDKYKNIGKTVAYATEEKSQKGPVYNVLEAREQFTKNGISFVQIDVGSAKEANETNGAIQRDDSFQSCAVKCLTSTPTCQIREKNITPKEVINMVLSICSHNFKQSKLQNCILAQGMGVPCEPSALDSASNSRTIINKAENDCIFQTCWGHFFESANVDDLKFLRMIDTLSTVNSLEDVKCMCQGRNPCPKENRFEHGASKRQHDSTKPLGGNERFIYPRGQTKFSKRCK